jgi:hypothetical protein
MWGCCRPPYRRHPTDWLWLSLPAEERQNPLMDPAIGSIRAQAPIGLGSRLRAIPHGQKASLNCLDKPKAALMELSTKRLQADHRA